MGIVHCRSYRLNTKSNYLRLLLAKIGVVLLINCLKIFFYNMSPISQDSIHSHETKVKRHIVYGVGCIILD